MSTFQGPSATLINSAVHLSRLRWHSRPRRHRSHLLGGETMLTLHPIHYITPEAQTVSRGQWRLPSQIHQICSCRCYSPSMPCSPRSKLHLGTTLSHSRGAQTVWHIDSSSPNPRTSRVSRGASSALGLLSAFCGKGCDRASSHSSFLSVGNPAVRCVQKGGGSPWSLDLLASGSHGLEGAFLALFNRIQMSHSRGTLFEVGTSVITKLVE